MTCSETQDLLFYSHSEDPPAIPAAVAEHAKYCAQCAQTVEFSRKLRVRLKAYFAEREMPRELRERLSLELAKLRGNDDVASEPVPHLVRHHLRQQGPIVFPTGEVALGAWEFGLLEELYRRDADTADAIVELICDRAYQELLRKVSLSDLVIVCFSRPMHRCGRRLAAKLVEKHRVHVPVVLADNYFTPVLRCGPKELTDKLCVVFLDVLHSGRLFERLATRCERARPREILGLVVIDQADRAACQTPRCSLWRDAPEGRISLDELKRLWNTTDNLRFFCPETGRSQQEPPEEFKDPVTARGTVWRRLQENGKLWQFVRKTGALHRDEKIGGVRYPWVIRVSRLLRDPDGRSELVSRAICCLKDLRAPGPWCLVYPACRYRVAGVWAGLLAKELGWPVVEVGRRNQRAYWFLTEEQKDCLHRHGRAVVVGTAIRSGNSLRALVDLLRDSSDEPVAELHACYVLAGLLGSERDELEKELKLSVRSLFSVDFLAPANSVREYCDRRLRSTLEQLRSLEGGEETWVEQLRQYCRKRLRGAAGKFRRRRNTEAELALAVDEGDRGAAAVLDSRERLRPSDIKHLDVSYLLNAPRLRNVLHGYVANSMPIPFVEWSALALATQDDFDWLDKDWLILHSKFFKDSRSWPLLLW